MRPAPAQATAGALVEMLTPERPQDLNILDQLAVDAVLLPPVAPGPGSRLLRVRVPSGGAPVVELLVDDDGRWSVVDVLELDFTNLDGPADPWLVRLGSRERFVAIVSGADGRPTRLRAFEASGRDLTRGVSVDLDRMVDGAGAADVDGDGEPELLVAGPPPPGSVAGIVGSCATALDVYDGRALTHVRGVDVGPLQLGGASFAELDGLPGMDLAATVTVSCPGAAPAGGSDAGDLVAFRLADGTALGSVALRPTDDPLAGPLPVRLADGMPDLLVAVDGVRTVVVDPAAGWVRRDVLPEHARPLGVLGAPVAAIALVRLAEERVGGIELVGLARSGDGSARAWHSVMSETRHPRLVARSAGSAVPRWPFAWNGDVDGDGCVDLVAPSLVATCGARGEAPASRHGPAWVATRPVGIVAGEPARLLVASSLAWDPAGDGLLDPMPLPAWDATGGWRGGPSAPFALAELAAQDLTYFADFPAPVPTVDRSIGRDPLETTAAGQSGDRFLVRWRPIDADQVEAPPDEPTLSAALRKVPAPDQHAIVIRSPVRSGGLSGVEDGPISVPLGRPDAAGDLRAWQIEIVAVNDWGEVAGPVVTNVALDVLGPGLVVDTPLLSAPWPFRAPITGRAEPGARVTLGGDTVHANRIGRFELRTSLAPWPQDLEVRAVDDEGNETTRRVSIMGGLDVRRLPWQAGLAALVLAAIAWTAFRGAAPRATGGRGGGSAIGADASDLAPAATIEDLDPGDQPALR